MVYYWFSRQLMSDLEILAMWLRVVSFSQWTRRSLAVKIYLIWVDVLRIVFSMDILYFTWNMLQYVTIYVCTLCICVYILNQEQAFRATDESLTTCRDSWTPCGLLGWDSQSFHSFSEFKDLQSSSGWIQKASRSGKEGSWGRDGTRLPSCLHSWWVSKSLLLTLIHS